MFELYTREMGCDEWPAKKAKTDSGQPSHPSYVRYIEALRGLVREITGAPPQAE